MGTAFSRGKQYASQWCRNFGGVRKEEYWYVGVCSAPGEDICLEEVWMALSLEIVCLFSVMVYIVRSGGMVL